jgi:hypothetical protein
MAFSGDGNKLVGNDGKIYGVELGAEVNGDGVTPLPVGRHLITKVAAVTGWPANSGAGDAVDIEPGYIIEFRTGDTVITPETDDDYIPLTETVLCDISAWSLEFSADEVETTTFCDDIKVYEPGKADASGNVSGIITLGETDSYEEYGLLRRFMDIVRQDGGDTIDLYQNLQTPILAELISNERTSKGDVLLYFAPVNLYGISLNAGVGGDAQTFESPMRITNQTAGADAVQIKPALYRFARG